MEERPLAIDLFCGLGGWTEGLVAEGFDVIGYDIERHDYGDGKRYPSKLILHDVLDINGSEFKDADLIVASPPCQEFSYMAMPWSKAKIIADEYRSGKRDVKKLTALFDACFRIQREAIAAAGHFIPMVVENVRGAQPWVGRARWNYGSYYLWGDVPALMPITIRASKVPGFRFDGSGKSFQAASVEGVKVGGLNWNDRTRKGQGFNTHAERNVKNNGGSWFNIGSPGQKETNRNPVHQLSAGWRAKHYEETAKAALADGVKGFTPNGEPLGKNTLRRKHSKSKARKAASATIAKIPLPLARWIARVYRPKSCFAFA